MATKSYALTDLTPDQLAQGYREMAAAGLQFEADGRIYKMDGGRKVYQPPWLAWQYTSVGRNPDWTEETSGSTKYLTDLGMALRTPGSDPSSVWHFMYQNGGPFVKRSQWDDTNGTYESSIDWGTLLGTIGAGSIIGAGVAAAAAGSSAAPAASAPAAAAPAASVPAATVPAVTAPAAAIPAAAAPAASIPAAAAPAATLPSTTIAPLAGALPAGTASGLVPAAMTGGAAVAGSSIPWGDIIRYGAGQGLNYLQNQQYQDALGRASQAQIDAVNKAIDLQSRIYDTTRADVNQARGGYKPYQQLGQSVLPQLYRMVGLTPPTTATGQSGVAIGQNGQMVGANGQPLGRPRLGTEPVEGGIREGQLTGVVPSNDRQWQMGGLSGGSPASSGGMVTVQAPTGETRRVPYDQAAYLQARGGRIVG